MAKGKRVPETWPKYLEDANTPLNNWAVKEIIIPWEDAYGSSEEPVITSTWEIPSQEATPINVNTVDANAPVNQWVKVWPQNANLNYNDYWDDSSPENQSTPWGLREKNTWEWVATSNNAYNPNADINNMEEYKYWEAGRQENAKSAGYLARRNDEIASALYNAWLVEKSDVIQYLANQPWWNDSTEMDRVNTVEAIYKRLWELDAQNEESTDEEVPTWWAEAMEQEFNNQQEEKIYWKDTPYEGNPEWWIPALNDKNLAFQQTQQSRVAKLKELESMDVSKVAYLISEWGNLFDEQTMRDLQQYNPTRYQAIMAEVKKIQSQNVVDQISTTWTINMSDATTAAENNVTTSMNNFVNSTASWSAAWTLATNLNNALSESEIVSGAREQMEVYKRKMVDIQQSIDELPSLANNYFKWDVPQYIVNAFINNRMQKYQKELEKYQNLYNASLDEAKWEVSQNQWREEMNYKWSSLQSDQNYKNANLALSQQELLYNMQKAAVSNWQWNDDWSYSYVDLNWIMHTLSKKDAEKLLNTDLYNKATSYIEYWQKALEDAQAAWMVLYWDQCEVMTDNYANQYWWVTMTKEDWTALTTVEDKAKYATEAIPQRGYVAIWDYWIKQSDWVNYWHTWIVIDYDPNTWKFTTLESNAKKDKNWNPIVSIQERDINSPNLLWFRDPSQWTPWNRKWTTTPVDPYYDFPMLDVYIAAQADANWVEAQNKVLSWREAYAILNKMEKTWQIDALLDDEVANALEEYNEWINQLYEVIAQWWQNAYLREILDNEWNFFADTLLQYLMNTWKLHISAEKKSALDSMLQLIQIKLRWESWAAINVSEWMQDYNLFLPQVWQSKQLRLQRISNLEHATASKYLPWDYIKQYIPVISQEWIDSLSEENKKDIIKGYED